MVSGTSTSRTIGSVGALNDWSVVTTSLLCLGLRPMRACQPWPPRESSPRVLSPRRLADSSFQAVSDFLAVLGLAGLSPGFVAGLCNVPSVVSFLAAGPSPGCGAAATTGFSDLATAAGTA